jgi:hypothetical protein
MSMTDDDRPLMMFAQPVSGWWRWFAWYPVRTWDHRWRWLCWVKRRLMQKKPWLDGPLSRDWFQHRVTSEQEA